MCLTSYKSARGGGDLLNSVTIWEACRATSAASSFFDSIAVGRYGEEFVDGATGANNPVWEVWSQAQLVWGPQPVEGRIKCLVSIGTGIPSLKPFWDDVFHIGITYQEKNIGTRYLFGVCSIVLMTKSLMQTLKSIEQFFSL